MRRSLVLRSLKFFHGLPQVSSRRFRTSASYARSARIAAMHEAATGEREGDRCTYICWLFSIVLRQKGSEFAAKSRDPERPADDENAPPTFAAGLIGDSDLESTVTILQQDFQGFWFRRHRMRLHGHIGCREGSERIMDGMCQRVGQTLALFPHLRRRLN